MFVDEADIWVRGGDGGAGCVAFRREKYEPMGGPAGGDGGRGGSVHLRADTSINTLSEFVGRHHWRADSGRPGEGSNCTGKSGEDLVILVAPGTQVYDRDLGLMLADLDKPGAEVCVARGGRGGRGNSAFATSTNQTPRTAEPGTPGQERSLHLELKLIADVGLVGLPNAGKSTLLSSVSAARPKIANYPFTTLEPQLGIAELPGERRIVLADLPGLIEGAHSGVGLGDAFLRHIERTRVLCHLVEAAPIECTDPVENYRIIRKEITLYSKKLGANPEVVVLTKMDLPGAEDVAQRMRKELGKDVLLISAVTGQGLRPLLERLWQRVEDVRAGRTEQKPEPARKKPSPRKKPSTKKAQPGTKRTKKTVVPKRTKTAARKLSKKKPASRRV